jgi:hypothetical protein|tara:strand:- start:3010 stop:3645 length:636 start_codon:yes stop_codon:yes gene_type:complete
MISDDSKQFNVEFKYESNGVIIWIKYHNTDMGQTISLSLDKKQWFEFPATLFSETTDYLRQNYSLLGGDKAVTQQVIPQHQVTHSQSKAQPKPQPKSQSQSQSQLPVPDIDVPDEEEVVEVPELANIEPIQSLHALAKGNTVKAGYKGPPVVIDNSQPPQATQADDQTESYSRPVIRSADRENKNLSDEELFQQSNAHRGHNEGRVISRVE